MDYYSRSRAQNMRKTDTHIYFWGSVLSNWHQGGKFSGARALELLLPRLEASKINFPPRSHRSTQHIVRHSFNCGEQFMMACKAWLFDRDPEATILRSILASKKPADQKAMGRKVPGFNETVWEAVSIKVVVASQIARAEVDPQLAIIYRKSGSRIFVEGSPYDTIWGVGLRWNEKLIENERNWKGKNKLGICHGWARQVLWEQEMTKWASATADQTSTETCREDAAEDAGEDATIVSTEAAVESAAEDAEEGTGKDSEEVPMENVREDMEQEFDVGDYFHPDRWAHQQ